MVRWSAVVVAAVVVAGCGGRPPGPDAVADDAAPEGRVLAAIPVDEATADSPYVNRTAWQVQAYLDADQDALDDVGAYDGSVSWRIVTYRNGAGPA